MLAVKKFSWGRQFFSRFLRLFLRNKVSKSSCNGYIFFILPLWGRQLKDSYNCFFLWGQQFSSFYNAMQQLIEVMTLPLLFLNLKYGTNVFI
ncbi:MAG: hypothetical protein A3F91_12180 [Flavobacteria bacterium RIFCSPLOWO2_12_FULL_35_11]|nr:MAG: hypothetical protein A3F91_12180 [Flavobacteria bacterium RIFCSPLOWO2_12_FULL_35_11]